MTTMQYAAMVRARVVDPHGPYRQMYPDAAMLPLNEVRYESFGNQVNALDMVTTTTRKLWMQQAALEKACVIHAYTASEEGGHSTLACFKLRAFLESKAFGSRQVVMPSGVVLNEASLIGRGARRGKGAGGKAVAFPAAL